VHPQAQQEINFVQKFLLLRGEGWREELLI